MSLARYEHCSVAIGGQILIFGGRSETTQIDLYDPTTDTWTVIQHKLLQPRHSFQAFAL
jgi:hypothetical protein